jgi:hypothetical protein
MRSSMLGILKAVTPRPLPSASIELKLNANHQVATKRLSLNY